MTTKTASTGNSQRTLIWPSAKATVSFLILPLMVCLTSCSTARVVVIPADREVTRMPASEAFTPTVPGWFVPDARMKEIMDALNDKANPHR